MSQQNSILGKKDYFALLGGSWTQAAQPPGGSVRDSGHVALRTQIAAGCCMGQGPKEHQPTLSYQPPAASFQDVGLKSQLSRRTRLSTAPQSVSPTLPSQSRSSLWPWTVGMTCLSLKVEKLGSHCYTYPWLRKGWRVPRENLFVVLGFDLGSSHLLGRHSYLLSHASDLFALVIL
jgi:hypothetical protein